MAIQKTTSFKQKDVALTFVKNIVMINSTCRDQLLYTFLENIKEGNRNVVEDMNCPGGMSIDDILDDTKSEDETEVNPLDLLFAIFKCSNLMLKQLLATKLFMCKLAIPFILPKFGNDPIEMCVWPLRSIILESKRQKISFQDMSVECPCEVVSVVRIGRPSVSKSKLLNEILTDQYHNTFSNKDCPLGTLKRAISNGMVETAWYIPSNKSSLLRNMTMFLNLRGDGITHSKQLSGVSQLADIVVVMVVISELESKVCTDLLYNILEQKKCAVLAVDALQNNKKDVKLKLQTFTKTFEKYQQNFNICILSVDGQVRSTANIKYEMRKAISGMMKENVEESLYKRVHKCQIATDEEEIAFRNGKQKALTVLHKIPKDCLNLKEAVLPLQGETWTAWSQKLKKVNKTQYRNMQEEGIIKKDMHKIRQEQMKKCENLGPFMEKFLALLSQSIKSDINCTIFVLWLKHFLDQRSRSVLPAILSQYQSDWQALKTSRERQEETTVIQRCRKALEKSERNLAEASFGFEHLCREMGQIYESINQCNPDSMNLKKLADSLPFITAKLLVMGHPFEIMDGDVANVPLVWVRAVLEEVRIMLGEKKLLALSVLGIQSSGKSTLLNTMFGLQFPVGAGRCTRGVFIQLVPVVIDNSKFDYVLVIDTEGLRAPELAYQKHSHDNELATFVIGLGDITVVNIKGENTDEMKDVLQIAVHAFLRLKLTNEKLNLKKTCIFVHQNVPASDAYDKMMQGRQKFVEFLDEMTKEAAEQENIADIQSFNQVIDFDSEKNVWYFSDLWHGDPPMAPVNPGYSESVINVKEAIMCRLTLGRNTYLTITDTTSRIEDLWNGILKDDFMFSCRNSLELKAYNSMDQQCQLITWKLEKYVLEFIKSDAKSKLVSCENEDALQNAVPTIMVQLCKEVDQQLKGLNHELNSFVEKSTLKDIMVQWTQAKRNRFNILAESLIMKAKSAINNTKEELRIKKLRVSEKTKYEIEINNMAKQLAFQMKGLVPKESVLREKFNSLWNSWIDKFATNDVRNITPIKEQIESMFYELFPSDASFIDDITRRLPNPIAYHGMKHLEGTLTIDCISTKRHLSIHKLIAGVFWCESSPETCKHQAIDFTNMIFRQIDIKLTEHNTDGIMFHPPYLAEILRIAAGKITDFNLHTENGYKFNLLHPFRAMILYHVVRYATVFFTKLNDVYNKKKSSKAQMEEYKGTVWELFRNTVENKTEEAVALGFFRDAMV
ncbi:interferon-induced very large GTPase 1-like [Mytilus edulis]|uniref:interferon-induced very large GTPase 1-like n=1 Tax=Mytilus edulis TaxID=6550 RepID=UPI0039EF33A1